MRQLLRAAFVIGRRDVTATVFSKSFLFFLVGPLFPLLIGGIFGGLSGAVISNTERPAVAVVGSEADYRALSDARERLSKVVDPVALIALTHALPEPDSAAQRARLLQSESPPVIGVLEGGLDQPRLTGAIRPESGAVRQLQLMLEQARVSNADAPAAGQLTLVRTEHSAGSLAPKRAMTGLAGQALLFLLTLLLATMLLSQMIDEKSNKIIEVLASAAPVEAIFLGKLFAMLFISLMGIMVWTAVAATGVAALVAGGNVDLASPALGWPAYLVLAAIYFSMSYLLLGAVFLGIGAQASSAREVQTMSMPVTMIQVLIFAMAATAAGDPYGGQGLFAAVFPLSSPFVMVAVAAERTEVWPHVLAIAWQALWVAMIVTIGARMFRRSVLKSGPRLSFRRKAKG